MNKYIRIFLISLSAFIAMNANAGNPQKYFEELSNNPEFSYSYVSPTMLKVMDDQYLADNMIRFELKTSDLTSIENIATNTGGQDEDLWRIIRQIKKDKKLETLSTKKAKNSRYDILARIDGKSITNLMVVSQAGGDQVNVVYMEGKIPLERFKYFMVE